MIVVLLDFDLQRPSLRRIIKGLGHKSKIFLAKFFLHSFKVVPHEILPTEGVGVGELVDPGGGVEVGEVHGVALVPHNDHVPGGARMLAPLSTGPLKCVT